MFARNIKKENEVPLRYLVGDKVWLRKSNEKNKCYGHELEVVFAPKGLDGSYTVKSHQLGVSLVVESQDIRKWWMKE